MPTEADVLYWICKGVAHDYGDGSSEIRLAAIKGKPGVPLEGMERVVRAANDAFEQGEIYDRWLRLVPSGSKARCPRCIERSMDPAIRELGGAVRVEVGTDLVLDSQGFLVRACQEHADEYRIEAHEAGRHAGEMFEEVCDGCWDEVRANERKAPARFGSWIPAVLRNPSAPS